MDHKYRGGSRIDGRGVLVRLASVGLRAQARQLGGSGGMPPQGNFLDFRSSEIVSDAFVSVIASYILRWR